MTVFFVIRNKCLFQMCVIAFLEHTYIRPWQCASLGPKIYRTRMHEILKKKENKGTTRTSCVDQKMKMACY